MEAIEPSMRKTTVIGLAALALAAVTLPAASPTAAQPPEAPAIDTAASAAEPLPLAPGFWESHLSALVINGHDRRCLREADILRYVHGWSNSIYTCTYPVSTAANGHVVWQGTCVSRGGRHLRIDAEGTYTQTAFRVTGHVASRYVGINFTAPFTSSARRLGDCSQFPNEPPPRRRR